MGIIWDESDRKKHRFWNTAPVDPLAEAKKRGLAWSAGKPLHPESAFPFGAHLGKTMRQVPVEFLRWVNAQEWAATWRQWAPVRDYLQRHPLADGAVPTVGLLVSPIEVHPGARGVFKDGAARLYVTREVWEPELVAFAHGALGLQPSWLRTGHAAPPHFLLSVERQAQAIAHGAELVTRHQLDEDRWHWKRSHSAGGTPFVREMPDGTTRCTKHCYANLKEAQTMINHRTQGRHRRRQGRPLYLRAYLCPQCHFYHLTSSPQRGDES